jgi:alpha-1,3-rhamnosyltransferase
VNPLISVIMCTYNHSEYVQDAIESVVKQTYKDWELIIIDNGSTDDTQKILQKYNDNPKVRIVSYEKNDFITKRINEGVRLANGDFISILYSDDYYLPEIFEKQIKCFGSLSHEWGVVHSPSFSFNVFTGEQKIQSCIPVSGYILKDIFTRYHEGFINPITPLIRKECMERYPLYEDIFTEGEGLFHRIAMKYKFYYINEPLAVMRVHDRNMSFVSKRNAEMTIVVLDRLAKHPDFPKEYLPYLRALYSRILRIYGWREVRLGSNTGFARKMFSESIRLDWKQFFHPITLAGEIMCLFSCEIRNKINLRINSLFGKKKIIHLEDYK